MRKFYFNLFFWLALSGSASAQVSGVIFDAGSGQPVAGVTAFVNRTTISTVSGENGEFALAGIAPGFVDLVLYKEGYRLFRAPVRVQPGRAFKLNLKLAAENKPAVSPAKRTREWRDHLQSFQSSLFGTTAAASTCKLLNSQAISFSVVRDTVKMHVSEPLILEDPALGYRITYYPEFSDMDSHQLPVSMILRYDTIVLQYSWERRECYRNREHFFMGSSRHFLLSLVQGLTVEQGFEMRDEQGQKLVPDSLVSLNKASGYNVLKFGARTQITYLADDMAGTRRMSVVVPTAAVAANAEGLLLDERTVQFSGDMAPAGIASLLPLNYNPYPTLESQHLRANMMNRYRERVYIQTDKPYYYPGEVIWWKGYVGYNDPTLRDSLSQVMYLELINSNKDIVMQRILKIEDGTTNGDLILPADLSPGDYYLRAYTHLMLNFGSTAPFVKAIPVINETGQVDASQGHQDEVRDTLLSVTTDKNRYKLREKINLTLKVVSGQPWRKAADLSIAVTDVSQVVPIPEKKVITTEFMAVDNQASPMPRSLIYPVEHGVAFAGQFVDDKGKKTKANIVIIQGKFENLIQRVTDDKGYFLESGFEFYDTAEFFVGGNDEQGKQFGSVRILPRETAPINLPDAEGTLKVLQTNTPQRTMSEYLGAPGVHVLQEVGVTASRLVASEFVTNKYGRPSRMFRGDQLTGNDMFDALLGRIVGLKVHYTTIAGISYRLLTFGHGKLMGTGITTPPPEPLIYVNGAFRGGGAFGSGPQAADVLAMINPILVDHIEIINTANTKINVEGGDGLIAIFTKPTTNKKTFDNVRIPGFNRARDFQSPDYEDPSTIMPSGDLRSTLYWHPSAKVAVDNEAHLSFFASDLPGKYRIVVEGVAMDGLPLRSVQYIEVEDH